MGRGGFDNHVFGEDWMPPSPSPRSLLSSVAGNDALVGSFPNAVDETKSGFGPYFQGPEGQYDPNNPLTQATTSVVAPVDSNALTEHKTSSRGGGLMERMAARAGFNAPRLNTESIWHSDLPKEQVRSPYLTIPPGLSPTTLLDSPVFLTNSLVQPSPTTGKFAFASGDNNWNATLMTTDAPDKYEERVFLENDMSFAFKPMVGSESAPDLKVINRKPTSMELAHASGSYPGFGISAHPDTSFPHQTAQAEKSTSNSMQEDEADPAGRNPAASGGAQAEDGYSWRKYGQKQVKGSEYPRSYYKCTHPNCPVKKKVERSHEGHITEIIYKGAHTHPKPPPARHSPALPEAELEGGGGSLVSSAINSNPETPSPPFCEYGGELSPAVGAGVPPGRYDPGEGGGLEGSSTFSNEEDNDNDHVKHGSVSLGYDREGDESELKRRRMEAYASEVSGATRAIREPRVVVQTTSEVDILDDGYRWRKYGQKVVKGNPNPRSYYKCTSPGCNVRKHVERASHDLKSVITTYEGKHNHDVPAARNSNQSNSGPTNQHAPTATIAARAHTQRPEPPQTHANMARFEMPSFGPYGLPGGPRHLGPGIGFGFGLGQQRLPGVGLASLGQHQIHPYLGYGPRAASDMGLVMPKTEPKVEPVMDGGSDGGSLAYQQLMSRFPLGPHM